MCIYIFNLMFFEIWICLMLSEGRLSGSVLSNGTHLAHCMARRTAASMLENLILGMLVSIVMLCTVVWYLQPLLQSFGYQSAWHRLSDGHLGHSHGWHVG